ncbi:MAG: hypothetical protein SWY16_03735 [Cyanobacteriota bacterium]|nr:hypothetical protein [Cyanobacteriota bacterium]
MINLSGMWRGTYWQQGIPTRFEMTLLHGRNTLSGNILDDDPLGEASVAGETTGCNLRFTKRYLGQTRHSVRYLGIVSEDGNFMQGQWQIEPFDRGHWEAHRSDENLSFTREMRKVDRVGLSQS